MFGFVRAFATAASDAAAGVGVAGGGSAVQQGADAAGAAGAAGAGGGILAMLVSMAPLLLMILVMYFIMIRPQRKKEKELRAQIAAMKVGDKVVTIGGICGKVVRIKDDYVFIESGNVGTPDEKSVIKFERSAIKAIETIHA